MEGNFGKADTSFKKEDALKRRLAPIENQINTISQAVTQSRTSLLSGLTGLETKIKDIEASQETIKVKIAGFEEQIQKFNAMPEVRTEPSCRSYRLNAIKQWPP